MWLGIGYLIPQKGDYSGGGGPFPPTYFLIGETDTNFLIAENGDSLVQEAAP